MNELYIKLIASVAPAIVLAVQMIRRDKVRPEPVGWLLGATGLGIVAGLAVILIGLIVFKPVEIDSFITAFYDAFVTAALPEVAMKLCMLAIIANRCKHLDEYFDGIVYAVCIGWGLPDLRTYFIFSVKKIGLLWVSRVRCFLFQLITSLQSLWEHSLPCHTLTNGIRNYISQCSACAGCRSWDVRFPMFQYCF